jgi:hypothetical protein
MYLNEALFNADFSPTFNALTDSFLLTGCETLLARTE